MDCVGPADAGRIDDAVDAKVALARLARADGDRLIRHADVARGAVAFGIHRHRREAKVTTRAHDAHRDLPAVGDEDLAQNQAILASAVRRLGSDAADIRKEERSLDSIKCTGCGLVNFATSVACRRCELPLAAHADDVSAAPLDDVGVVPLELRSSEGGRSFGRWVLWILGVVVTVLTTAYVSLLLTSEPVTP